MAIENTKKLALYLLLTVPFRNISDRTDSIFIGRSNDPFKSVARVEGKVPAVFN